jgi:hypothetical protein
MKLQDYPRATVDQAKHHGSDPLDLDNALPSKAEIAGVRVLQNGCRVDVRVG